MAMRMRLRPLLLGFVIVLLDCATLEPLPNETCGNGVIDAKEDCDTFPSDQCNQASAGAAKCRLFCGTKTVKGADGKDAPKTFACPDGWGCSVDSFCRQPDGTFETAQEPVSAGVTTMLVGDFDGDGRKDVLGSSGPTSKGRIHYFKTASAPQVVPLPGVLAAPVIYDFDGDGRSDIAFGYTFRGARTVDDVLEPDSTGGYAIVVGQRDRAVVTKLFPTFTVPKFDALIVPLAATTPVNIPKSAIGNEILSVATVQQKTGGRITLLRSVDGDPTDTISGFLKVLPGTLDDLAGEPISAIIFDGAPKSTCGEIVVPVRTSGGANIQIHSPCERLGGQVVWSKGDPKELNLPGETLDRVFVVDLDNDRHQDIIIGTILANGKTKVRVAYGTGTDLEMVDAPPDLTEVPLAVGFLDTDQRPDFVIPSGVLLSARFALGAADAGADGGPDLDGGGPPPTPRASLAWTSIPAPTKRWTVAQIADVNRDFIPDVIAASKFEPDIDVLEGTLTVNLPPFTIPTTGSVTNLVVGDFDFDRNADIAFVQARASSTDREVAIAYGRALTMPPEAPRPAGRLEGIRQLFVGTTGVTITSTSAAEKAGDLPTFAFAVLLASGERQPVAPLLFNVTGDPSGGAPSPTTRQELTTRALVASPVQDPTSPLKVDLIGLVSQTEYARANGKKTSDAAYGVWIAPGQGPASFVSPSKAITLPFFTAVDRTSDTFLVQMASRDLDGDGRAEIAAVAPDVNGTGAVLYIIHPGKQTSLPTPTPIPDRSAPAGVRSQFLDVDGDGKDDLVVILRDMKKKALRVNVFFGDGKSNLAVPGTTIELPVPDGAASDDYDALGFAQITTAGAPIGATTGKRHELVIVTPKHLFRAFMRPDRTLDVTDAAAIFGGITYGSSVAAGDFDGDGVDDIAIADQGSIRIARQKPRLE